MMYVQCSLISNKNYVLTTWLPQEKGVGLGAKLTLKDEEGLWTITKVGGTANQEQVLLQRDLNRHHRKATDI